MGDERTGEVLMERDREGEGAAKNSGGKKKSCMISFYAGSKNNTNVYAKQKQTQRQT